MYPLKRRRKKKVSKKHKTKHGKFCFFLRRVIIHVEGCVLRLQVVFVYFVNPIGSVYGTFTYICYKNQPNVGKYTSPMDPMGTG